ncbi:hypothetical protein DFA_09737 [Cavenderia fasciculata]|uniref:Uncharacterized protein n=1 Tax=Cavenderia fasciculata TaxID=261658 RepID=F4Q8G5_CACFS|nr:uncharacterized protein DFA_09737 [Cavenderia fasciculata]EGG16065.1 hypothetical protein DFA_09737 [Cavenderia fasciculata]|eukprot:XP_004352390.1 hypothetical protein DFA_09737 [Cavenderia fasciculata]
MLLDELIESYGFDFITSEVSCPKGCKTSWKVSDIRWILTFYERTCCYLKVKQTPFASTVKHTDSSRAKEFQTVAAQKGFVIPTIPQSITTKGVVANKSICRHCDQEEKELVNTFDTASIAR